MVRITRGRSRRNHFNLIGNNDGKNLAEAAQFHSKEVTKSSVTEDFVKSNPLLYKPGEKPDHVVRTS